MGIRFLHFLYTICHTTAFVDFKCYLCNCALFDPEGYGNCEIQGSHNRENGYDYCSCGLSCHVFGSNIPPVPGKKKP